MYTRRVCYILVYLNATVVGFVKDSVQLEPGHQASVQPVRPSLSMVQELAEFEQTRRL